MNKILSKRYVFCDFSKIVGFPNPVPSSDEWEHNLPRFRGEEWEVPAEHLLDFHDFIHRLEIVHEDVQIRLFFFSLEGIACEWCRSLPNASVSSLTDFHSTFNSFCKELFPDDLLYPECCHEFHLLTKDSDVHEKYVAIENTLQYPEIVDPHYDSHEDALNIVSDSSIKDDCHDDQIIPSENFQDVEQIDKSTSNSFRSAVNDEGSLQFQDLQRLEICSRHEEGEEEHKELDQQYIMHVSVIEVEQFTVDMEIGESHRHGSMSIFSWNNYLKRYSLTFVMTLLPIIWNL
jgi:hypothetical protein